MVRLETPVKMRKGEAPVGVPVSAVSVVDSVDMVMVVSKREVQWLRVARD